MAGEVAGEGVGAGARAGAGTGAVAETAVGAGAASIYINTEHVPSLGLPLAYAVEQVITRGGMRG